MRFTLSDPLIEEIEIGGITYHLNLYFDTVLLFYDLMDDEDFTPARKIEIAAEMFMDFEELPFETKFQAVQKIVETFIQGEDEEGGEGESGEKLYDLKQDAGYIYASFLQEYNIDLIDQQGVLRWEKFIALLSGLRDDTRFKEIVGIRAAELPSTKDAPQERKRLQKLQKLYALDKDQKTRDRELNQMFDTLVNQGGK